MGLNYWPDWSFSFSHGSHRSQKTFIFTFTFFVSSEKSIWVLLIESWVARCNFSGRCMLTVKRVWSKEAARSRWERRRRRRRGHRTRRRRRRRTTTTIMTRRIRRLPGQDEKGRRRGRRRHRTSLSWSFRQKSSCFRRFFNESQFAFGELSMKIN